MADTRITVTARRTFECGGRAYVAGETLTLSPIEAAALHYRGKVALASDDWRVAPPPRAVTAPPAPAAQTAASRRAQRRAERAQREGQVDA